ncbi:hypothetical protein AHAS_Ahas11G0121200 [Arachis hypogaea]
MACAAFVDWINNYNIIDLGFSGSRHIWRGLQRDEQDRIFKRLNRALANADWRTTFQEANVEVLPRVSLNHHSLLISLHNKGPNQIRDKSFHYEAM